ncbi:transposon Ty3-I Gag-Pol polyprotein [Trichonephila clavipes]|nr:transposon Ty3-I Gag-Pol polyprotein [Trichonephila clavipes]
MPSPAFRREYTVLHTKCIRTLPRGKSSDERRRKSVTPMKGVAEDIYQALLTREINDTASFIKWCNYIEDMKQKRVGRPRFERLQTSEKRLSLTTLETADGTSTTLALEEEIRRPNSSRRFTPSPTREADPQYVVTDPRRHIADPVSRQAVGARKTKESDLQGGWDFLEASQAVIDCGQNELVLEDICRDSTAPDAWNLYATRDYTLKPHSLTRITVSGYQNPRRHKCSSRRQQTFALREKYCYTVHEKQAIRTTPKFSGLFTKTDKSTAAKTNVKHRIFTGDHAPINQRAYRVSPTERRIIHEEVQKMLDEGIVQPSESPLVITHCARFCYLAEPLQSLLKSGVEFHWGPEEVEAFNSLKKALTSDPVLGMYDERASTEIHTDASGYGIGAVLVQIQNNVEKVIAYASRTLTKAEKNYSTTERMSCHRMGYQQISAVHIRKTLYCCN